MSVLLQLFTHISEHFACSYPREIPPTVFCELVHLAYGVTVEKNFNPVSYFFNMYIAFLFYLPSFYFISSLKFLGSPLKP